MSKKVDAVIIGAGVIGAATACELARKGYRTLNIDKLPASGYGPTSASCAIVRAHYSSWDGVAMAYEGFSYWKDWEGYLGVVDDAGTAKYMNCGTLLLESATGHHEKVLKHYDDIGVEYEEWDTARLKERMPIFDTHAFWPPKRPEDPRFWDGSEQELPGAIFTPGSGYVNDPQLATHNLQRAAEAKGGEFMFRAAVGEIRRSNGRVTGVDADRRPGDRGADRHQRRRPALVRHQPHGRRRGGHEGQDARAAPRGPPRALAAGLRLRGRRAAHLRRRHRDLLPPRERQPHPDRQRGPRLRPAASGSTIPTTTTVTSPRRSGTAQVYRLARRIPTLPIPNERKGVVDLYDVLRRLDPDLRQVRRRRLLHGHRHERQPVQERAGRRPRHGRADRPRASRATTTTRTRSR